MTGHERAETLNRLCTEALSEHNADNLIRLLETIDHILQEKEKTLNAVKPAA
jgi:hypothetical protein